MGAVDGYVYVGMDLVVASPTGDAMEVQGKKHEMSNTMLDKDTWLEPDITCYEKRSTWSFHTLCICSGASTAFFTLCTVAETLLTV